MKFKCERMTSLEVDGRQVTLVPHETVVELDYDISAVNGYFYRVDNEKKSVVEKRLITPRVPKVKK